MRIIDRNSLKQREKATENGTGRDRISRPEKNKREREQHVCGIPKKCHKLKIVKEEKDKIG